MGTLSCSHVLISAGKGVCVSGKGVDGVWKETVNAFVGGGVIVFVKEKDHGNKGMVCLCKEDFEIDDSLQVESAFVEEATATFASQVVESGCNVVEEILIWNLFASLEEVNDAVAGYHSAIAHRQTAVVYLVEVEGVAEDFFFWGVQANDLSEMEEESPFYHLVSDILQEVELQGVKEVALGIYHGVRVDLAVHDHLCVVEETFSSFHRHSTRWQT